MKHSQKTIKNSIQKAINDEVISAMGKMWKDYLAQEPITGYAKSSWKRLRTCNAYVLTLDKWFILKSYDTIVACVSRETGITFDFLRFVYVYTATSTQHIAKFANDYGWRLLDNKMVKTYYSI